VKETDVIHQVLRGDVDSFRLLVERYEGPVIRMIINVTGDSHICEDIAQDVFFTAYKKLGTFDPDRSSFSTWLFTIARNRSINAMKKKSALTVSALPEMAMHNNPSDNLVKKELFDELDRALESLPGRQKRVFVLAELERLSYREIAQIEGIRIGTVKSRINRAKNKLRSVFETIEEGVR
jgi:RNA polymerase sigma-70 factor (ECF subfamily)